MNIGIFHYNLCWVFFNVVLERKEESFNKNNTYQKNFKYLKEKITEVIIWHHENGKIVSKTGKTFLVDQKLVTN